MGSPQHIEGILETEKANGTPGIPRRSAMHKQHAGQLRNAGRRGPEGATAVESLSVILRHAIATSLDSSDLVRRCEIWNPSMLLPLFAFLALAQGCADVGREEGEPHSVIPTFLVGIAVFCILAAFSAIWRRRRELFTKTCGTNWDVTGSEKNKNGMLMWGCRKKEYFWRLGWHKRWIYDGRAENGDRVANQARLCPTCYHIVKEQDEQITALKQGKQGKAAIWEPVAWGLAQLIKMNPEAEAPATYEDAVPRHPHTMAYDLLCHLVEMYGVGFHDGFLKECRRLSAPPWYAPGTINSPPRGDLECNARYVLDLRLRIRRALMEQEQQ